MIHILPSVSVVRDLGIMISNDLKVKAHCIEISKKASRIVNMLFRIFETRNVSALLMAYKVYVRPIMEYCSPAWSPSHYGDIDMHENVQRYFTRRVFYRCNLNYVSYPERLKLLGLEPLEERRLKNDLVMCYNIIHKEVDLDFDMFFNRAITDNTRRNHSLKLYVRRVSKSAFAHFFSNRVVPIWNSLPSHINGHPLVTAMNTKLFRKRLNSVDLNQYMFHDRHM